MTFAADFWTAGTVLTALFCLTLTGLWYAGRLKRQFDQTMLGPYDYNVRRNLKVYPDDREMSDEQEDRP